MIATHGVGYGVGSLPAGVARGDNAAVREGNDLRALTRYLLLVDWDALMDFMMRGLEIGPYAPKT